MTTPKNIFITGKPGSGKTTLVREVCLRFKGEVGGFYTEEMREGRGRMGFVLKTFDGQSRVLAKKGMASPHRLNKYGIDIETIENTGVNALRKALSEKKVIVIDEIGSMETVSELFRETVFECLNSPSRVLATIRFQAQPFTNEVKQLEDTRLIYLSRDNFAEVKKEVLEWMGKEI
jgi:nucleoside-triphosphatase